MPFYYSERTKCPLTTPDNQKFGAIFLTWINKSSAPSFTVDNRELKNILNNIWEKEGNLRDLSEVDLIILMLWELTCTG